MGEVLLGMLGGALLICVVRLANRRRTAAPAVVGDHIANYREALRRHQQYVEIDRGRRPLQLDAHARRLALEREATGFIVRGVIGCQGAATNELHVLTVRIRHRDPNVDWRLEHGRIAEQERQAIEAVHDMARLAYGSAVADAVMRREYPEYA